MHAKFGVKELKPHSENQRFAQGLGAEPIGSCRACFFLEEGPVESADRALEGPCAMATVCCKRPCGASGDLARKTAAVRFGGRDHVSKGPPRASKSSDDRGLVNFEIVSRLTV